MRVLQGCFECLNVASKGGGIMRRRRKLSSKRGLTMMETMLLLAVVGAIIVAAGPKVSQKVSSTYDASIGKMDQTNAVVDAGLNISDNHIPNP